MTTRDDAWKKVKKALKKPYTPETGKEAGQAFREFEKKTEKSNPILVSLSLNKYPRQIPLEQIPEELEKNPQFYELMKRIVATDETPDEDEEEESEEGY